jgi:flagellar assembly protein FliH
MDADNKILIEVDAYEAASDERDSLAIEMDTNMAPEELSENIIINATRKSEAMIKEALKEAEEIVREAKEQASRDVDSILAQSREQGYKEGLDNAEYEAGQIRAEADAVLQDAVRERQQMQASLEPEMVDLIIRVLSKLLDDTVKINPQIIMNLIKQGMASSTITGDVSVHVSQYDYETVTENKDEILALADGSVKLEIIKDLSLNQMDCVIETAFGSIDCSLGQKFESLRDNLTYILNG